MIESIWDQVTHILRRMTITSDDTAAFTESSHFPGIIGYFTFGTKFASISAGTGRNEMILIRYVLSVVLLF